MVSLANFDRLRPIAGLLLLLALTGASRFEAAVLDELNAIRTDPGEYGERLLDYRDRFDGLIVYGENGEPDVQTREGVGPVDEAITALRRVGPLPELREGRLLALAAGDHVAAQSRSGEVGHYSRGRNPPARLVARGGGRYVSEVITYGHSDPESVIRQLLVDDGVPGRGHRFELLSARYRYAGVACGPHPQWRAMCVIELSETPDGSAPPPPRRDNAGS